MQAEFRIRQLNYCAIGFNGRPGIWYCLSTFWFGICSTRDLVRLFRDLEAREQSGGGEDAGDDGRVAAA